MLNKNTPILVTGASGYIASWIVLQLLEQSYKVHAAVRNKSKVDKIDHLLKMQEKYGQNLKLYEADLLKDGSFAKAMEGCEVVIHTASPFQLNVKDVEKELVAPALEGTRNVLKQANQTPTVKRVVLTSSCAAIYGDAMDLQKTEKGVFTEAHWNSSSTMKHEPYSYSKTIAEQEAWKIQKQQNQWDLVVINPSFVMGPSLSKRKDGESVAFMIQMLSGGFKTGVPNLTFGYVDVRDVAAAHVLAATKPEAKGRHILSQGSYSMLEVANILRKEFGSRFQLPTMEVPKFLMYIVGPIMAGMSWDYITKNIALPLIFDNSYSKENLGLTYRNIETTFKEHAEQLIEIGEVK